MKKKKLFKIGKKKLIIALTVLSVLVVSLGAFFSLPFIKGEVVEPPKPTQIPDWDNTNIEVLGHRFEITDSVVKDQIQTAVSQPGVIVEYKNKQPISWWDFFDAEDHGTMSGGQSNLDAVLQLAKHSYFIYPLPGVSTFFLIIDNSTNTTVGIFKKITINKCYTGGASGGTTTCPWKYYKAYSSWGGSTDPFVYTKECKNWNDPDCNMLKPEYELKASSQDQKTLLYKYIQSTNSDKYVISGAGGKALTCAKPGSELSGDEYAKCFFPEGGRFPVGIKDNGDKPPTITVSGSTFDQTKHPGAERPPITFTLSYVLTSGSVISSGIGGGLSGANYFYFVATNPSYPNLAIRLLNCKEENYFVATGDKEKLNDDEEIGKSLTGVAEPIVQIDQKSLTSFVNKVYSGGPYKDGDCPIDQLNVEDTGQLAKWGVERVNREEVEGETSACEKQMCSGYGITSGFNIFSAAFWKRMMCTMSCAIYDTLASFGYKVMEWLNKAASVSRELFIEKAHAATLAEQIKGGGKIAAGWRYSLAIVDIVVVFALIAIGFANMLKINIDVYSIKRALPGLLLGVIFANFSLLICRLIVDFATLLTQHFLDLGGGDNLIVNLIAAMGIEKALLVGAGALIFGLITGIGAVGGACIGIIVFGIFLGIPVLLMLVLAFLLYARIYVVWLLVILAPLAFITLGLPPAASYFSKWWSWFMKWVFMAPISYFFLGMAAYISKFAGVPLERVLAADDSVSQATGLSWLGGWFLFVVVMSLAIYIPWTIGGTIMKMWGALGARAAKYGLGLANFYTAGLTDWASRTKLGSRLKIKKWAPKQAAIGFMAMRAQREKEQYSGMMGTAYDSSMKKVGRGLFPAGWTPEKGFYYKWGKGPTTFKGKLERELAQMKEAEEYKFVLEIGDREVAAMKAIESDDAWTAEVLMYAMPMTGDVRKNVFNEYAKKFGGQLSKQWIAAMEIEDDDQRREALSALTDPNNPNYRPENVESFDPNDIKVGEVAMTLGRLATYNNRPLEKYPQETIDIDKTGRVKFRIRTDVEQKDLIASQMLQMPGRGRARIAQEFWEEMVIPESISDADLTEINTRYRAKGGTVDLKRGNTKPFILSPKEVPLRLRPYVATFEQQAGYALIDKETAHAIKVGEHVLRDDIASAMELDKRGEIDGIQRAGEWADIISKYAAKDLDLNAFTNLHAIEGWFTRERGRPAGRPPGGGGGGGAPPGPSRPAVGREAPIGPPAPRGPTAEQEKALLERQTRLARDSLRMGLPPDQYHELIDTLTRDTTPDLSTTRRLIDGYGRRGYVSDEEATGLTVDKLSPLRTRLRGMRVELLRRARGG